MERIDAESASRIWSVDRVETGSIEIVQPGLIIVAVGQCAAQGRSNPQLIPHVYDRLPNDCIWDFDFVAAPAEPGGLVTRAFQGTVAKFVWPVPPKQLKGVRVHSSRNHVIKMI